MILHKVIQKIYVQIWINRSCKCHKSKSPRFSSSSELSLRRVLTSTVVSFIPGSLGVSTHLLFSIFSLENISWRGSRALYWSCAVCSFFNESIMFCLIISACSLIISATSLLDRAWNASIRTVTTVAIGPIYWTPPDYPANHSRYYYYNRDESKLEELIIPKLVPHCFPSCTLYSTTLYKLMYCTQSITHIFLFRIGYKALHRVPP